MTINKCLLITGFLLINYVYSVVAQVKESLAFSAPSGLLCDLISYTDYQSINGYPTAPAWSVKAFKQGQSVKISSRQPAFSWEFPGSAFNTIQSAYRILVASHPDSLYNGTGNIWDSGKINSSQSSAIIFQGRALLTETLYYWQVKVWNNKGEESPFSKSAVFYTDNELLDYATTRYPIQKTDELALNLVKSNNIFRADFGKAAFGQLKLTLSSPKEDTILVHLGEAINSNGSINRKPGGTIRYHQYSLPLKPGTHTYQVQIKPDKRNTGRTAIKMPDYIGEVLPFRYVEIENYSSVLKKENLIRTSVHYFFDDFSSEFSSSDTVLNSVWDLCKYSIKATSFAGIYVDGDRERIPYEADAYINQLCHYAVDKEFSMARYSHEYLIKHATWPAEWILQSVLMAWNDYLYSGDLRSANHYYNDLKAKTLMGLEEKNGLISTRTGKQDNEMMKSIHFKGDSLRDIVDWPHKGILGLGKAEGGETDGFVFTDYNAVVNAYYYKALIDMSGLARALNKTEDALMFAKKAAAVKKSYQKLFWDSARKVYKDGISTSHASLHSNMFALAFGLVKEKDLKSVLSFIQSRGMACSVYGSQFLMDALYDGGAADYGLSLLRSQDERSWYNMIRAGSTITMEAWDNKYKPNQDWNHAWGAVPANIIPRKLMGIEPITPGWSVFRIKPQLGSLEWGAIKVPTIKGNIAVKCEQKNGKFLMSADIPANTKAQIVLPLIKGKNILLVNGNNISFKIKDNFMVLPELGSGKYTINVSGKK